MASGMKTYGKHRFPGRLFIVEGIDGSGKSTQLSLLAEMARVGRLRRLLQRMEFLAAGSRRDQTRQEEKDVDADDF